MTDEQQEMVDQLEAAYQANPQASRPGILVSREWLWRFRKLAPYDSPDIGHTHAAAWPYPIYKGVGIHYDLDRAGGEPPVLVENHPWWDSWDYVTRDVPGGARKPEWLA